MEKPKVFIGSSTEAITIAETVASSLRTVSEPDVWHQGIFNLGNTTIETFFQLLNTYEYAILILSGDDILIQREQEFISSNQNVIFELGLFMSHFGRKRTFIIYDKHKRPQIISDLLGITYAAYDSSITNKYVALSDACLKIKTAITANHPDETWYTQWHLGNKLYKETLKLWKQEIGSVINGKRIYEEVGGSTQIFDVRGFEGKGIYWLEYNLRNGDGGGTLTIIHRNNGKMEGMISAGHCDRLMLRGYVNIWTVSPDVYNKMWLKQLVDYQIC